MMRRLAIAVLAILAMMVALVFAGATYQAIASHADARRHPEPGRLVDVGGYRLKINCTGRGSSTVVLEAGLGDVSIEWSRVQPEIAKFARACSYDRAGYGGSDAGPMPRTSAQIAKELHALLQNAGEAPPFLLVGSSFGGYNVRVYNGSYPDQVTGIVLADATQEDQYRLLPAAWGGVFDLQLRRYKDQARWAPFFIGLGIARLKLHTRGLDDNSYLILQPKYLRARASELENIKLSAEQARAAGHISEKPLIVLTGGKNSDEMLSNALTRQDFDDFHRIWVDELQTRLFHLSIQGEQIILADSGHDIPNERPDAIVAAVRKLCTLASRPSSRFEMNRLGVRASVESRKVPARLAPRASENLIQPIETTRLTPTHYSHRLSPNRGATSVAGVKSVCLDTKDNSRQARAHCTDGSARPAPSLSPCSANGRKTSLTRASELNRLSPIRQQQMLQSRIPLALNCKDNSENGSEWRKHQWA
jgi:pimeloyl-ACP methyl ester carboxylesterase